LSSEPVDAAAATRAGFVARLTKPVRLSELYDAVVRAIMPAVIEGPTTAVSQSPATGSRGMLLIVEDQTINQEVARGMVAKLGFGCDVAGDGIEALAALERRSYAVVLMDCHMPEMDGFEATAEIRRREAGRRHQPIIAMTAGAMVEDREKCFAAGMDDYVSKPVKERELEAVLNRWLGTGPRRPDPESSDRSPESAGDEVLDLEQFDGLRLLAMASGDPGFLRGFVDQYLDQAASQLAELRAAAADGDERAVKELTHGLKGMSATMGASGMASACAALEEAAGRGRDGEAAGLDSVGLALKLTTVALRAQTAAT
jgi:CheY-like chemotaxis protein